MEGNYNNERPRRPETHPGAPKGARLAFGILMICVYIGVGLLFIFNIFDTIDKTVSIIVGALLCLYGVWRGYRLYKGMN